MEKIASSVKLNFYHIINIKPYILLQILGQEFVSTEVEEGWLYSGNEVGTVKFGQVSGTIHREEEVFYLSLADGRKFTFTNEN